MKHGGSDFPRQARIQGRGLSPNHLGNAIQGKGEYLMVYQIFSGPPRWHFPSNTSRTFRESSCIWNGFWMNPRQPRLMIDLASPSAL
jgi:hypothetical protein